MTCFYMKNGQTMREFCREHKYDYQNVMRLCDRKGLTPEEAVKEYVNRPSRWKYVIDGIPLSKYCKIHGISYDTVLGRVLYKGYTLKEAVKRSL